MANDEISDSRSPRGVMAWRFAISCFVIGSLTIALVLRNPGPVRPGSAAGLPVDRAMESLKPPPAITNPTITRFDLGGIPVRGPVAAYGALWTIVQDREDFTLSLLRVDTASGAIQKVRLGKDSPKMLAAGFDAIWVAGCPHEQPSINCVDGTVYRVDPATARITERVLIGSNIAALATGEGACGWASGPT